LKILFLATYFPRPLNPTIGTWALEQAKALKRNTEPMPAGAGWEDCHRQPSGQDERERTSQKLKAESGNLALDSGRSAFDTPSGALRVVSGNPWFPKLAGKLKSGIRVYSDCPRSHSWDGVAVDYLPMLFYPFGKLDSIFNRVGEPMLRLGWWSIKGRLMKVVEEFQPDVVYAHHTVPNGYFAMRIYEQTGIPFVVTDHDMGEITACEIFPARRAVYEKVISFAHRMVSVAGVMRKDMERVFPQARCEVIHNGINLARAPSESRATPAYSPATRNSLPANAPEVPPLVILSCGMFYERKNFPGLIQVFNIVAEKYPNVILRILGDGPDRIQVEQARFASPFKDRIELTGKVGHAEVLQQMQESDIFALIGWREPFATVFLEAMAAGLPVIACNDGGIAEVIAGVGLPEKLKPGKAENLKHHNTNGLLVPPRDIPAAARALEFLILNPEARKQVGAVAREKTETDLTWDAVARKYLELFEEAKGKKTEIRNAESLKNISKDQCIGPL
jgi:glycosyltransferase involved in cell wall biosynthesis